MTSRVKKYFKYGGAKCVRTTTFTDAFGRAFSARVRTNRKTGLGFVTIPKEAFEMPDIKIELRLPVPAPIPDYPLDCPTLISEIPIGTMMVSTNIEHPTISIFRGLKIMQ